MADRKVIITCAITGSIHTPTMSPYLPVTPEQIAREAIDAAEAGAAILHLHARNPEDGRPSPAPEDYLRYLPEVAAKTDAVLNLTTGGAPNMTVRDRLRGPLQLQPEMCSLNMGSMNFGLYPMLRKHAEWKHDWEPKYLEGSRDFIFRNTFADIESILKEMGDGTGARFEFECYDVGHLYTLAHFLERKLVKPPLFIQFVMGILGGIGAEPENLVFLHQTARRLLGNAFEFSVLGAGRHQMSLAALSASLGGHVRVGLEDNLYISKGQLAKSNAEQVRAIRNVLQGMSLQIATPADVRAMLQLKGKQETVLA